MSCAWEHVHALTMVPGLFLPGMTYKIFCLCSIMYHAFRSVSIHVSSLQRADLMSQLVVCFVHCSRTKHRVVIGGIACASLALDISKNRHKLVHICLNGVAILLAAWGYGFVSLVAWGAVVWCGVVFNMTKNHGFHALMHLLSHIAFITSQTCL